MNAEWTENLWTDKWWLNERNFLPFKIALVRRMSYLMDCWNVLQVDSPMNLRNPHDLVILMRQETTVNYLKELEVKHNLMY